MPRELALCLVCSCFAWSTASCRCQRQGLPDTSHSSTVELSYAALTPAWSKRYDKAIVPDVSFLNREHGPAGSHGRLRRRASTLVFTDGTPARFWGTNLTARALFDGSDEQMDAMATRLACLGFNLVRLHHHDSPWVRPNVIADVGSSGRLNPRTFGSIGRWVKHLQQHGIYVWLDLHVGREFRPDDQLEGFAEIARDDSRGFTYVNSDLQRAWVDFALAYLTMTNPHTGRSFADDPAVVAVLLTNENDVTFHFGNRMLRDEPNPVHTRMLEALAADFASTTGLPRRRLLRTWEPGPAKLFLNELEHRVYQRWQQALTQGGVEALVATTSTWGNSPLFSLPALTAGDLIDVHSYGESESLSQDPRRAPNFATWLAAAQVAGYPLTVSEWGVPFPARDRFVAPLYVASIASLQGWDAVLQYAYQQYPVSEPQDSVDKWSAADDPAIMAQMPAAAVLFRRGDVTTARRTYRLEIDAKAFYGQPISPETSNALRTLVEQSRVVIGLPDTHELSWDSFARPSGQEVLRNAFQSFISDSAAEVVSDTGELTRNWAEGYQLIDTPRTQAAAGWIGGQEIHLGSLTLAIATKKAAVAVTSLDDDPIQSSKRLLVSAAAQAVAPGDQLPFRSEPVVGTLSIRSRSRCLRSVGSSETHTRRLAATPDTVTLVLSERDESHWYLVEPCSDSSSQ